MNKLGSKALTGFKYIYLAIFFALLSGFFYPLINNLPGDSVVIGTIILFVGLAGGVLLYKAATAEKRRMIFLAAGFGLIALSLGYILQLTGRL